MIKSMTGYGRAQAIIDGRDILVEIRSVNHRYYEFSSRVPRAYGYLDEKLKSLLKENVARGKVEAAVSINNLEGRDSLIEINKPLAEGYLKALREAGSEYGLADDISLSKLAKFPDIFTVRKATEDEEEIWLAVKTVALQALEKFISMRENEGKSLETDILKKLAVIENGVGFIEENVPALTENYRNRLYARLKEVLEDKNIDEQRIITECAIFSEKIAVDEEMVRLKSHLQQFKNLLKSSEPVGRKLDFLVQEMNREVNTAGSKAQDIEITKTVVDLKTEIEKIREQIQNIE